MSTPLRFSFLQPARRSRALSLLLVCVACAAIAGCRKTTVWSPDSKQIALEADGGLVVYDVTNGTSRTLVKGEIKEHEALAPAWSPNSKQIAYFDARSDENDRLTVSLVVMEPATGKRDIVANPAPAGMASEDDPLSPVRDYGAIDWSPDGRELAYVVSETHGGVIWVVSAMGGAPRRLSAPDRQSAMPAWLPDGKRLTYLSAPSGDDAEWTAEIVDRDGANRRTLFHAPNGMQLTSGLHWSADGKTAGVIVHKANHDDNAPPESEAYLVNPADGALRKLAAVPAHPWSITFTPDLKSLVFLQEVEQAAGGKLARVAVLEPPYAKPKVIEHPAAYESPDMSIPLLAPDGLTIALQIRQGGRSMLGLRYLDGRGPADFAIGD